MTDIKSMSIEELKDLMAAAKGEAFSGQADLQLAA